MSAAGADLVELGIEALGAAGDGIARVGDGSRRAAGVGHDDNVPHDDNSSRGGTRVFVPFTLPGERWRVRLAGERGTAVEPVALVQRADPVCRHFGSCGGCALQHAPEATYRAFKRDRLVQALRRRGLGETPVGPVACSPLGSRRRLRLACHPNPRGALRLGLRMRLSHRVLALEECPIADPALVALFGPLAADLTGLPVDAVSLTLTAGGVAALLHPRGRLDLRRQERLAGVADRLDLAALHWGEEPVAVRRQPCIHPSGMTVALPPGAFLQATADGEAALVAAVTEWGEGAHRALDLYAGLGTLGLALATKGTVLRSVETHAPSVAALKAVAVRGLTAEVRDLARRPLAGAELAGVDLAILDPPRAGAAAQVQALAASPVSRIVYAACSPETFARDARTLTDAGYALLEVRPIDQFLFAAEIELIALFERRQRPKSP